MNKTQFYSLSSALLASTALATTANAGTIGRFAVGDVFTTVPVSLSTSIFSSTASTANGVTIGGNAGGESHFGMRYTNNFGGTTHWTTEFTISGARFITAGLTTANVILLTSTASNVATVSGSILGSTACASVTSLVDLFVVNDCVITGQAGGTGVAYGVKFTGVTFNSASGLVTAGTSVSLTGRVYNPTNTSQIFEASSTGTIITSANPYQVIVTPAATATASATTTPVAFANLSAPNDGSLSLRLVSLGLSATGALGNALTAASSVAISAAGTTSISVASTILSSTAVQSVSLVSAAGGVGAILTLANFSGGTVTFSVTNTLWAGGSNSAIVVVAFSGSQAIPSAAAGTLTASIQGDQQSYTGTGTTAAINQGGFRAEINTFNSSTNGPFGSYLRIHNNGQVAGTVTITVRNDATGEVVGSAYTTASIAPNATVQYSALQIETGAAVPTASRTGSYTVSVTGPIVGYAQHILFDGNSVADLSGFRNSGSTDGRP